MRQRLLPVLLLAIVVLPLLFYQISAASPGATAEPQKPAPTPEALAHAKKLYTYDCAVCHGPNGNGKGDMSADFPGKIKDYTNPETLKGFTDDQLFTIIKDGKGDMPPEGKRAKTDEIWALVNLVRSFAKKE